MPKGERAGYATYWTKFGQGVRKALLIHCSLAHSGSWGGVARHLSGMLDITAFDMPGHGRSAAWDERGEIQAVTADIAASFLDEPTDIIGHSFGATVALRLAVERPELVRSLVLIEPVFFGVAFADTPGLAAQFEAEVAEFEEAMKTGDYLAAARAFTATWGDGTPWAAIPAAQRDMLAGQMHLVGAGAQALYNDAGGMLASGALGQITVPVLLIEGSKSPDIIAAINAGLAARMVNSERAVIAGAGHMAPITHAQQVSSEIQRFLQRT